jgi:hypothetical protein
MSIVAMRNPIHYAALGLLLAGCTQQPGCTVLTAPDPQDCASLSKARWTIYMYGSAVPVPVGHSRQLSLDPNVESQCEASVTSVVWSTEAPGVADVIADGPAFHGRAWVTGVTPGQTAVTARIGFSDGTTQAAPPTPFRVDALDVSSAQSTLVAEGALEVDAPAPGRQQSRFATFFVPAPGNLDVTVDWLSPLNNVSVVLFEGACSTAPCSARLVTSVRDDHVKPRVASGRVAAGDYSIRIDNVGPGAESCRYQVRLRP